MSTRRAGGALALHLALVAVASGQTPAGPEFRANTYTTGHQMNPRVAMEPDADFVVVWNSAGQDGSSDGVFATQFQADGAPRGAAFLVNGYTTGRQGDPEVAVGRKGDFVVVWTSGQDGSFTSVHGRRYDALATPVTAEFLVNTYTSGAQYFPVVGLAANGSFVVSWTSDGGDGSLQGISARRFTASGNPIGAEFVVNTYTSGRQRTVALAVESDGDFVVVWEDYSNNRDGSGAAIFGQRYSAAGTRLGGEFLVNTYTTGSQLRPSVSMSPAGGFAVVWTSPDGNLIGIRSRRFDPSGNALGRSPGASARP